MTGIDPEFIPPTTSTTPPAQAAQPAGPHAEPGDHEETYFDGSPPTRALTGAVAIWGLAALVLLAIAGLLIYKHVGPWWLKAAIIVIGLILPLVPVAMVKTIRYRISNYRIDYERGVFSKEIDTLELWHVEDIHFHQSLLDRMLNVGTITVTSRDESMPILRVRGIPNPRPLYETLKQRVIAVKRQRGVMKVDPG